MDINQLLLYSDDTVIAVNKPAGLLVIPDGYDQTLPHLSGMLQKTFGKVWTVHRLDKDTSGVILFALTKEAHRELSQQFEQRKTRKEYHCIVVGMAEFESTVINLPLRINGDRRHRTVIDHQTGKPAETALEVIESLGLFTLLKAYPHTGYTHQIRAHLAAIDLPILADPLYQSLQGETQVSSRAAAIAERLPINRTALHARQITFLHPASQVSMTITAGYPQDFSEAYAFLAHIRDGQENHPL